MAPTLLTGFLSLLLSAWAVLLPVLAVLPIRAVLPVLPLILLVPFGGPPLSPDQAAVRWVVPPSPPEKNILLLHLVKY